MLPALFMQTLKCEGLHGRAHDDCSFAPDDPSVSAKTFFRLRTLRSVSFREWSAAESSMGMSGDLEQAVAEGSTMIRVEFRLYLATEWSEKVFI